MRTYWNSEQAQNWTGALVLAITGALCVYLEMDQTGWTSSLTIKGTLFTLTTLCFTIFVSDWSASHRSRILTLLWIELGLICALYAIVDISFVAILGIVWIVQAAETFDIRITSWLLAMMVVLFAISQLYHLGQDSPAVAISSAVTLGLFHLFAVITTHRANREQALREETAQLNRELVATRELLLQSSRQNERLRIARDLHDLLGHHLTALILNLEVATHITEGKGQQKVEQALALGKLLLGDLRTAVSELREDDSINLQQALHALVQDTPRLQIALDLQTSDVHDVAIAEAILRCTQESLTNCLRHSNATHCAITLSRDANALTLRIQDNGSTVTDIKPGNGIKGMMERIADLGGTLNWHLNQHSGEQGFVMTVTLPIEKNPTTEHS